MGGVASDFGQIMKAIMSDVNIRELLLIPIAEQTNGKIIDKYVCQGISSSIITTEAICRIIVSSNPSNSTNNPYVREDMLAIEVFVPNAIGSDNLDRKNIPLFERRSNQIVDAVIKLLNNKRVNDRKFHLEARHELTSSTVGFCRHFMQFSYRRVYN
jgi:hypothetical protein